MATKCVHSLFLYTSLQRLNRSIRICWSVTKSVDQVVPGNDPPRCKIILWFTIKIPWLTVVTTEISDIVQYFQMVNIDVPAGTPPFDTQLLGFLTTNCFPLHITPSLAHFQATLKAQIYLYIAVRDLGAMEHPRLPQTQTTRLRFLSYLNILKLNCEIISHILLPKVLNHHTCHFCVTTLKQISS